MVDILIRLKVRDFDVFWQGFQDGGASLRQRHGSRGVSVLRSQDDPQAVVLHFKWESRQSFSEFLQDPQVQDSMVKGGAIGKLEVEHLEPVGDLPA